ncbi:uncharacterized protein DSM5745_03739 [Aspergillus mulundensis]|uniref:Uncharacterized protein n=1 Tax=Aspergillus mulundensis TaxID=1810919 RepID=A0A3D8SL96_9EURO|nr:hypothetical protein DSM5745_03739 [Aspergillus mulundensis]RDW87097.1 hypothetical protein DSM5745_03739 [Aspergillus mulundensis]
MSLINPSAPADGECLINRLPPEILSMICEFLAQEVENKCPAIIQRSLGHIAPSITRERRNLLALACTSRRFHAVVQPFLYRTIILTNAGDHRHLLRALDKHPEIAKRVQHLIMVERLETGRPFIYRPSTLKDEEIISGLRPAPKARSVNPLRCTGGYRPLAHLKLPILSALEAPKMLAERVLSRDIAKLWTTVRRANSWNARSWSPLQKNQRDSVLDLLELLLLLPRLRQFRYLPCPEERRYCGPMQQTSHGYPEPLPTREIFLTMLGNLQPTSQPVLYNDLLACLQDIDIPDLRHPSYLNTLDTIMSLPNLHTLRSCGSRLRGPHAATTKQWKSSSLRALIFHQKGYDIPDIPHLIAAVTSLEVLHLELYSKRDLVYEANRPNAVVGALAQAQAATLRELRIVHSSPGKFRYNGRGSPAAPRVDLSLFHQLVSVHLPDDVVFDYRADTYQGRIKLPPRLVDLAVDCFASAEGAAKCLECLAEAVKTEHYLPHLRKIKMAAWNRPPPPIITVRTMRVSTFEDRLRMVQRGFALRGVRFRYERNGHAVNW